MLAALPGRTRPTGVEVLCADAGTTAVVRRARFPPISCSSAACSATSPTPTSCTRSTCCRRCAHPAPTVIWTRHRRPPDATPALRDAVREPRIRGGRVPRSRGHDVLRRHASSGRVAAGVPTRRAALRLRRLQDDRDVRAPSADSRIGSGAPRSRRGCVPTRRPFVDKLGTFDGHRSADAARARRLVAARIRMPRTRHARRADRTCSARASARSSRFSCRWAATNASSRIVTTNRIRGSSPSNSRKRRKAFAAMLDGLDDAGWGRTGMYNYPEPALRTVEWIAIHTTHELLHHRGDLG